MENQKTWGALINEVAAEQFPSMHKDVPHFVTLTALMGLAYVALMPALLFMS